MSPGKRSRRSRPRSSSRKRRRSSSRSHSRSRPRSRRRSRSRSSTSESSSRERSPIRRRHHYYRAFLSGKRSPISGRSRRSVKWRCKLCQAPFFSFLALQDHIRIGACLSPGANEDIKLHKCFHCQETFGSRRALKAHITENRHRLPLATIRAIVAVDKAEEGRGNDDANKPTTEPSAHTASTSQKDSNEMVYSQLNVGLSDESNKKVSSSALSQSDESYLYNFMTKPFEPPVNTPN